MKKFILPLVFVTLFSACKKDDSSTPALKGKTFTINATSKSTWTYFSFVSDDTIKVADPANSLKWDLAFQRFNIRTNSGLSGKGAGGAYNTMKIGDTEFSSMTKVPDSVSFAVDDSVSVTGAMGVTTKALINPVFKEWYNYSEGGTLLSKSYVYIVKTADGKYAKLMITSYYNEQGSTSGYVTFNYVYQPDGSKNFE